ncbi:ABC transporter ATP-binding protein [Bythopirellula goksoeyrii]|uniref:Lipoprotein-releasing system ATP-binding protein LolD n=1 Tax=Bythopirellula goksoeyrii TaxID=1400387 RepID=A0A5B9Q9Y8_9BACT|nr:ABC transporter ATP-binding protein [Bythopirellula goksoeyrii]QEG35864.1 Lipoprotein-releasing system ATP-binding protein LolD [Bythopirellula goksoeyrii]
MYQLQSVTQTYKRRHNVATALDNCNLEVSDNDYIAIVGPSGSGKTTLLSILGGLLAPSSGIVLFGDRSLYGMSIDERTKLRSDKIGFVFQSVNLVTWLSACENVQIPLMLSGKPEEEQRERGLQLLERVGLSDRADHLPSELSPGQQQRVALARTLANDPQVILADEPTRNLDSGTGQQVMSYLSDFHRNGQTIIIATQDAGTAAFAKQRIQLVEGVTYELDRLSAA